MTKQDLKVIAWACLDGAVLAIVIGGGRSVMRAHLFEFSEDVTGVYLLQWAFLGVALAMFFAPEMVPGGFRSPQRLETVAGAAVGLAGAIMSYGGMLSIIIGLAVGALVGFLAPYWKPHLR